MELDTNDLEDMYSYMHDQDLSNGMMDMPGTEANNLRNQIQQQANLMSNTRLSPGNGMMDTNDLDEAMMEENLREYRRQSSMGAFSLQSYLNFVGQVDSSGLSQVSIDGAGVDGLPLFAGSSMLGTGAGVNGQDVATGMLDMNMPTVQSDMLPSIQGFMPLANQPTQEDLSVDPLDTTAMSDDITPTNEDGPPAAVLATTEAGSIVSKPTFNMKAVKMENIYSSSGFDMIGLLMRVATRPNPQISIGAVDMSCAFVVCDARKFDMPIVYCSATFERLTGYTKHEILGRNCRFLQAPDGIVMAGIKRKYVDDDAVFYLKARCESKKECQISIINYRKGGQPFMNLLTTIPITWDSPDIAYIVGFQVDLVDQPGSIMNKNQDGSIVINYQHRQPPVYYPIPQIESRNHLPGTTISREDVSRLLTSIGAVDSEASRRLWDKVLLENTDDVVHVLSLKGLFLYCSPSTRKILEYDPQDLVGTAISTVCHPSDIVPVTRDLKDTSSCSTVNVVFRIRRKFSGYTWFESYGCLHTEQGKGRKCIILIGRERPVYMLKWKDVYAAGGIGENEIWTKMSLSGMYLFVASNVKTLLDREPEELMGMSMQALMRPDSRLDVNRALDGARMGKRTTVRHEIQNKRGQYLQAVTTFFPEAVKDKVTGDKPTFLVAQTRLVKHSRASMAAGGNNKHGENASMSSKQSSTASLWSRSPGSSSKGPAGGQDNTTATDNGEDLTSGTEQSDENIFDELKTTRSSSWQFELRQMQRTNKRLLEELMSLLATRKKRKRRNGADQVEKDCANCHTRVTPEWRRGPSGKRDLCNSCGLRYAKLVGRVSPRTHGTNSNQEDTSPQHQSPLTNPSMTVEAVSQPETPVSPRETLSPIVA